MEKSPSSRRRLKVLWAIDALEPLPDILQKSVLFLKDMNRSFQLEVHPTFVLGPTQLGISMEYTAPHLESFLLTGGQKALESSVQELEIPGMAERNVLIHHKRSLKGSVQKLLNYSERHRFDLILVGSHGREGLQRLVLGSFAEELILKSKLPVLVVGPQMVIRTEAKNRVLIPNDLIENDSPFMEEAIDLVKNMGADATLLHVIPKPVESILQSGVYLLSGSWIPIPTYLAEEKERQNTRAKGIQNYAAEKGVPLKTIIDHVGGNIVTSILNYANEEKCSMIIMEGQSGSVETALFGSITRKVVRAAPCPVWITRSGEVSRGE